MKISYKREMKHNYLVAEPEEGSSAGYEACMLAGNDVPGLLRMRIKYQDGLPFYCYDITSRQPLSRLLETRFITGDEIRRLLIQLHGTLARMEEYLLGDGGILMEPEYIYVEPELFQVGFCLLPGHDGNFSEELSRFLQYILKRVNHKDRECVVLAYGLYQESLKDNYGIEDLLSLIAAESKKDIYAEEKGGLMYKNTCEEAEHEERGETALPDKPFQTAEEKSQIQSPRLSLKKQALFWLSAVLLLPSALWIFRGRTVVFELRYIFLWIDGILLALLVTVDILLLKYGDYKKENLETLDRKREEDTWRILYDEDEEQPLLPPSENAGTGGMHPASSPQPGAPVPVFPCAQPEETFQTVLLTDLAGDETVRRLTALQTSGEDIVISYYPFVIGKHKELADYVLAKDTISRFHLRIDKEGGSYQVTDMNSTNGTKINGRPLEANETVNIELGDEIYIAEVGYLFS